MAVGTFVTIIERKYCEVLLMMTTDQRRMWMIYLTMAASLIMTDSANNGGGGAVCAQEREMRYHQLLALGAVTILSLPTRATPCFIRPALRSLT